MNEINNGDEREGVAGVNGAAAFAVEETKAFSPDGEVVDNIALADKAALSAAKILAENPNGDVCRRKGEFDGWIRIARLHIDIAAAKGLRENANVKPTQPAQVSSLSPSSRRAAAVSSEAPVELTAFESDCLNITRESLSDFIAPEEVNARIYKTSTTIHTPTGPQRGALVRLVFRGYDRSVVPEIGFGAAGAERVNRKHINKPSDLRNFEGEILDAFDETPEGYKLQSGQ